MRKRSLIAGAILLFGMQATLVAQEIGIKAGASFGNISNKDVLPGNLKNRTGFAAGLYLGSGGLLGIGVEALYAQRGAESDETAAAAEETRLDYIDIPAYLKVKLPVPAIKPFIYAGPQASYEIKCRTATGADCGAYGTSGRKRWDYAGVIGAGVRIGGGTGFGIEGRYVYGLQDLKPSTLTSGSSYKTRSFLLLGSIGR